MGEVEEGGGGGGEKGGGEGDERLCRKGHGRVKGRR